MSLILEALNKAENERNDAPTQPTPSDWPEHTNNRQWWKISFITLAAITLGATAVYLSSPTFDIMTASNTELSNDDSSIAAEPQDTTKSTSTISTEESIKNTATKTTQNIKEEHQESPKGTHTTRLQSFATTQDIKPAAVDTTHSQEESSRKQPLSQLDDHKQEKSASDKNQEYVLSGNQDSTLVANNNITNASYNNIPIAQNLPATIKSKLPNLKLDIHIYSAEPSKRFVYINSRRYREGANIDGHLVLKEITPTGAILMYQETPFRLIIEG